MSNKRFSQTGGGFFLLLFFLSLVSSARAGLEVSNISPNHGPRGGDTVLTIHGEGFSSRTKASLWGGGIYRKGSHLTQGSANALSSNGSYCYVACGTDGEPSGYGLQIFNVQDTTAPQSVAFFPLSHKVNDVFVFGNYAYLAASGSGLQILDLHNPTAPSLVSTMTLPKGKAHKIAILASYLYLAAENGGLMIIDIHNPQQPTLLSSYAQPIGSYVLDVVVEGNYVYCAKGWGGLEIVDISDPMNQHSLATYNSGYFVNGLYKYQNNLYLAEMENGVEIIDIANPSDPVKRSRLTTPGLVHRVAIQGSFLYVADDYRGVEIFNHDPQACTMVGFLATPGWAVDLQVVNDLIFVADAHAGLQILDAVNPRNPTIISIIDLLEGSVGLQVNGLYLQEDYAYLFSKSYSSEDNWLKIIDIADPRSPQVRGKTLNIGPNPEDMVVAWDYAYVVDGESGLQVFNVAYKQSPQRVSFTDTDTSGGQGIFLDNNKLFLADSLSNGRAAVKIFSLDTKRLPVLEGKCSLTNSEASAEAIWPVGDYAIMAAGSLGFEIFDLHTLHSPTSLVQVTLPGYQQDLASFGPFAYLADKAGWIKSFNISNITNPYLSGSCKITDEPRSLALGGNHLYVAEGSSGVEIIDIGDEAHPMTVASLSTLTPAEKIAANGDYIYVAIENGIMVLEAIKACPEVTFLDHNTLRVRTPSGLSSGTYHLTVADPNGQIFVWPNSFTVEANRPPTITIKALLPQGLSIEPGQSVISVAEGQELKLILEGIDPDGDHLTYSVSWLPSGASLNGNLFTWKPGYNDTGIHPDIQFMAADGEFIDQQSFDIYVSDDLLNANLELWPIGNKEVGEGLNLSISLSAEYTGNDSIVFSAVPIPEGASLTYGASQTEAFFSWTPRYDQAGLYSICFTVAEEYDSLVKSETIQITVQNRDSMVKLEGPNSIDSQEGKAIAFFLEAMNFSGGNSQAIQISLLDAPVGATFQMLSQTQEKVRGLFLWTPTFSQAGEYNILFRAFDQQMNETQKSMIVRIADTPNSLSVDFQAGTNQWIIPAGRANYSSFDFLEELGQDKIFSLRAYDWHLRLKYSTYWFFGRPGGDDFPMDQSLLGMVDLKQAVFFSWP